MTALLRSTAVLGAVLVCQTAPFAFASVLPLPQEPPAPRIVLVAPTEHPEAPPPARDLDVEEDEIEEEIVDDFGAGQPVKLGISTKEVDATLAAQLGIEAEQTLVVNQVAPGGAAEKAGLRVHDVLVTVNGKPATLDNLRAERDASGGERPLVLELRRRARRLEIVVWGPPRDRTPGPAGPTRAGAGQGGAIGLGGGVRPGARRPAAAGDLRRELDELRDRVAEIERRLEGRGAPDEEREADEQDLRRRELGRALRHMIEERDRLGAELDELRRDRESIGAKERESLDGRIRELEEQLERMAVETNELGEQLRKAQQRGRRGTLRPAEPERRIEVERRDRERSDRDGDREHREMDRRSSNVERLSRRLASLHQALASLEARRTEMATMIDALRSRAAQQPGPEIEIKLAELERHRGELDSESSRLKDRLAATESDLRETEKDPTETRKF